MANKFTMKLDKSQLEELIQDIKKGITQISTQKDAEKLGKNVVETMKEMIASGVSPIGGRKFQSYKKSYNDAIKKGRYDGLGKYPTPVNLKLTGDFLDNLRFRIVDSGRNKVAEVGFFDKQSQLKEQGHREGANSQKKRPIIPINDEKIARTLKKTLLSHYQELMVEAINRAKAKKR